MTREEAIKILPDMKGAGEDLDTAIDLAIEALSQSTSELLTDKEQIKERKGSWKRMSEYNEKYDTRYKCSMCGNVVRHRDNVNLFTFNRWCGMCGSLNEKIEPWHDDFL